MQIYNRKNFELISNKKGLFAHQILEINSDIIILTYLSREEESYYMIVLNIHNLQVLSYITHSLSGDLTRTFKYAKNMEFYLYANQIEYLAIYYPKFLESNYFIKNDVQIKKINKYLSNVVLLKNNILAFLCKSDLIIEKKILLFLM